MRKSRIVLLVVLLLQGMCQDAWADDDAAKNWMTYLQGSWEFESVDSDASGRFVVSKTPVDHVLEVKAFDKNNRAFVVSTYVWDADERKLLLLGGYKTTDGEGAFMVTFDKLTKDKLSGKDNRGEIVGYQRMGDREWHVTGDGGKVNIKLKREKPKEE